MRVTKKTFTWAASILFFLINLIFFIKFTPYKLLQRKFLFFMKSPTFSSSIQTSIRPNKFGSWKCLNVEFYWPNVFHYGFEIQSLTWITLLISAFTASQHILKIWMNLVSKIVKFINKKSFYSFKGVSFLIWGYLTWFHYRLQVSLAFWQVQYSFCMNWVQIWKTQAFTFT